MNNLYYAYKNLFDKKIENSTIVVLLIALMIVLAASIFSPNNTSLAYGKASMVETQIEHGVVVIWWKQYKLVLEKAD